MIRHGGTRMIKKAVLLTAGVAILIGCAVLLGFIQNRKASGGREIGLRLLSEQRDYQLALVNLRQFGRPEDMKKIAPLLDNGDPDVQAQAILTMETLSGHSIPVPPELGGTGKESATVGCGLRTDQKDVFKQYVSSWKDWWERQQPHAAGADKPRR